MRNKKNISSENFLRKKVSEVVCKIIEENYSVYVE